MQTTLCCAWDVSVTTASKNRCATVAVITAVGAKHHRTSGAVAVITACWGPEHHKTSWSSTLQTNGAHGALSCAARFPRLVASGRQALRPDRSLHHGLAHAPFAR